MDKKPVLTKILISIGIVLIPFYEVLFRFFPYVYVNSGDTRVHKSICAVWIALIIGLCSIYSGEIKAFKNKFVLLLVGYLLLNFHLGFRPEFQMNRIESGAFWVWKPFFFSLCYFLMLISAASIEFSKEEVNKIIKIMSTCGIVMAGYIVLQRFDITQFFITKTAQSFTSVTNYNLVGTLGQPTIVSPFIAMMIPISLYLRRYVWSIFMMAIVIIVNSQVAIGAMILSLIIYSVIKRPRSIIIFLIIIVMLGGLLFSRRDKIKIEGNGRFAAWKQVVQFWRDSPVEGSKQKYSITGDGLGSFSYIFPERYKNSSIRKGAVISKFNQAHNEYLEMLCVIGIIGLSLFLLALYSMSMGVDFHLNMNIALYSSFMCIALCGLGTFIWQLGVYQFYSVLLFGLLSNQQIQGGKK